MAKLSKRKEEKKLFGNLGSGNQKKQSKEHVPTKHDSSAYSTRSNDNVQVKRMTLKELKKECPLGFRKFELEVGLDSIDEEIALQLWEDVYKPLYTFW